jgi:hypothetical protein
VAQEADHLMVARKQKERKRKGWGPDILFKGMPSIT